MHKLDILFIAQTVLNHMDHIWVCGVSSVSDKKQVVNLHWSRLYAGGPYNTLPLKATCLDPHLMWIVGAGLDLGQRQEC